MCEELFDAADRVHGRLPQCRETMVHVVELAQYGALFPRVAEPLHGLLDSLQRAGQAAATLLNNASLVAGKFIDDRARQNEGHISLSHQLFECGHNRLLLVILGDIKPYARVNQDVERR